MVDEERFSSLVKDVDRFVIMLTNDNDLALHEKVNQFFYMEKVAELRVLSDRIEELRSRLNILEASASNCYQLVSERLTSDQAWLSSHRAFRESNQSR